MSSGRSGRLGRWPGVHRAGTLRPRPPDMQEPGPRAQQQGASHCLGPGRSREWEQHADGADGPGEGPAAVGLGEGRLTSHRSPCAQPRARGTGPAGSEASCRPAQGVWGPLLGRGFYGEKRASSAGQDSWPPGQAQDPLTQGPVPSLPRVLQEPRGQGQEVQDDVHALLPAIQGCWVFVAEGSREVRADRSVGKVCKS